MHCLFNVSTPNKKVEWTAELDNAKLRLADFNNPGWYLQEENGMIGKTAVLRRTLPLISAIVPLFLQESKYTVRQMIFICFISDALCDLVPFAQFKKCEKHPWRSVTFRSLQLY